MPRFSAKLLFEFRMNSPTVEARTGALFEESMITFRSRNARSAAERARAAGRAREYNYDGAKGDRVFFTFLGIMEMLELGLECEADEVWYDIRRYRSRRKIRRLVLPDDLLNAVYLEERARIERRDKADAAKRLKRRKRS